MKYQVIESQRWQRDDGAIASIYGACPWVSRDEKARWQIVTVGWTVRDLTLGTIGCGRQPFKTREEADEFVAKFSK